MKLFFLLLAIVILAGCATQYGQYPDGTQYSQYDVHFDEEKTRYYIPLEKNNLKKK